MLTYITSFLLLLIGEAKGDPCGSTTQAESGVISSPNYPGSFPSQSQCTWIVQRPKGNWIQINFTAIDIRASVGCYDGSVTVLNRFGGTVGSYCRDKQPNQPLATNNEAEVKFEASGATGTGFSLKYQSYPCGGRINAASGEISSPNYPNYYPNSIECTWEFVKRGDQKVKIVFLNFDVDYQENCGQDSVKLIDVIRNQEHVSGVYCGKVTASVAYSKSSTFRVRFTTNGFTANNGFRLRYSTVSSADLPVNPFPPDPCNMKFTDASGIIKSPNYPYAYLTKTPCTWTIERPREEWIGIEFLDLDLEKNEYVTLSDDTQVIGKYGGTQKPCEPLATNYKAVIKFNANTATSKRGFIIRYMANASCNRDIYGGSGEIHSPNYPNKYPRMECTWKIKAPPGKKVYVEFIELDTVYSDDCTSNGVTVIDVVSGTQQKVGVFCGSMKPAPTVSTDNELWIKFHSITQRPKRGFALKYATEWFRTFTYIKTLLLVP